MGLFMSDNQFYLYKYRAINDYTINSLINNELFFSDPNDFNDPFDSRCNAIYDGTDSEWNEWSRKYNIPSNELENFKNYWRHGNGGINSFNEEMHKDYKRKFRVLSLSEVYDDILMWSHYSDSHKGICLQFNTIKIGKTPCIKFDESYVDYPSAILPKGFLPTVSVKYQLEYPETHNRLRDPPEKLTKFFLTKHIDWKYEKERRIILFHKYIKSNPIKFNSEMLSGVIFGMNIEISNIRLIKSILDEYYYSKNIHVKLYRSIPRADIYGIDIYEIVNYEDFMFGMQS